MSLPTNLFVDAPEMQDASMHPMGESFEQWPEELVQKFKERIPSAASMSILVKFMKKDEENGTATGSLVVSDAKKQAIVPVIIKDFMLYPLDVFVADKKLLPLTPDYFKAVFQNNSVFQNLEEYPSYGGLGRFEDSNLWNATYPPSLGRYAYASANYEILNDIVDTIDGSSLRETLLSDPQSAVRFQKHGHSEAIKKIANLKAVNMNEFRQGADNLIPRNFTMLRKEGPNKYTILSNSDKTFSPAITRVGREDLEKFVSKISNCAEDDINDVDQNGEKILSLPVSSGEHLEVGDSPLIEQADHFDHYSVKKKNGLEVEGVVIPKVIDFDMEVVPLKIFIGKTMGTIQPEIAGIRVKNSRFKLNAEDPRVGQTGCFVFQPDKSHALATVPVTIKSIVDDCGRKKISAMTLMGVGKRLVFGDASLERIAFVNDEYLMPKIFKWVPMEGFEEVTSNAADFAVKTAGQNRSTTPVKLLSTGYDQYALKGVDKYAHACGWDATNLSKYQVQFILGSFGMGQEKLAHSFKQASASGQSIIHGLKFTPLKEEKIAKALPVARTLSKVAESLRCNLIKEASHFENSQTVDALLSLNFVNPENVSKFVSKIPALKTAISNLASLLLGSRLGMKEIPELSTTTAMHKLIEVVNGLESLRATQEG